MKRDIIEKEILVSLKGYSFKIVKFMIFITFTKSQFHNKKSGSSHPKIYKIIHKKSQKPSLCKNSQNLQKTPGIESLF